MSDLANLVTILSQMSAGPARGRYGCETIGRMPRNPRKPDHTSRSKYKPRIQELTPAWRRAAHG